LSISFLDITWFVAYKEINSIGKKDFMMKTIQVELPEKTAAELDALVKSGWFTSQSEIVRTALTEFIMRHRLALIEKFQQEDIDWALSLKSTHK
jgi:Arc/MetJ-type ribon-helix-helix transcriptional regulator